MDDNPHTPHAPRGPGRNAQGTVSRCYLCGRQFTHQPVLGLRNGANFRFCSAACESTSTADAGDGLPVAGAPKAAKQQSRKAENEGSLPDSLSRCPADPSPSAPDRRAQVAAEMRSFHMNQVALEGLSRVRGGMKVKGEPVELADAADIGESIDRRRGSLLAKVISFGMEASMAVRVYRKTVERVAEERGTSAMAVLHAICMYDADCRGLLAHVGCRGGAGGDQRDSETGGRQQGSGLESPPPCCSPLLSPPDSLNPCLADPCAADRCPPTPHFSILQAEIAAGIRGIDGEFRGVFASLPDTLDPEGRSANRGEI